LRTNTKDGLPVISPRGLLNRLNLRQILAQRFVFFIRPGKTFHLSASPKNIAASLDPQIMPLSEAQREISDWSIERKHFRASPQISLISQTSSRYSNTSLVDAQIQHDWTQRISSWSNLSVCLFHLFLVI